MSILVLDKCGALCVQLVSGSLGTSTDASCLPWCLSYGMMRALARTFFCGCLLLVTAGTGDNSCLKNSELLAEVLHDKQIIYVVWAP